MRRVSGGLSECPQAADLDRRTAADPWADPQDAALFVQLLHCVRRG